MNARRNDVTQNPLEAPGSDHRSGEALARPIGRVVRCLVAPALAIMNRMNYVLKFLLVGLLLLLPFAEAVDARFASQRSRALRLHDGRLMGRPPGEGSPYLLTGLLRCSCCGGGMEVLSRKGSKARRLFEYRCYTARRKGPSVCANSLPAPMEETDASILCAIEDTLLHRAVIERGLAHAEALILNDRSGEQRRALEAQMAETETAIRRLTAAIAKGGELAPLVAALETHEQQRKNVAENLATLRAPRPSFDVAEVRATLDTYLADWRKLLRGHVHQAQQIVRRLVKGRLTMVPQEAGYYTFTGTGTVKPLLTGAIRNLASPPGFDETYFELPLTGDNRRAA